jgi:hypothetical protein
VGRLSRLARWLPWRLRLSSRPPGQVPTDGKVPGPPPDPAPGWHATLQRAVDLARPACRRCGNDHVKVEWRDDLSWIPVQHHFVFSDSLFDGCPALNGGYAAWESHELLWTALDPYLPRADYGEVSFSRRELAEVAA